MRFFLTAVYCRIKLSLNRYFFAALVLFGISMAFVSVGIGRQDGLKINVGVYADTEAAMKLYRALSEASGGEIEVIHYNDQQRLKSDVSARRLECGYVITDEAIAGAGKILAYVSAESVGDSATDILLTTVFLEGKAGEFGYKTVKAYLPKELRGGAAENISLRNQKYLENAEAMKIEYSVLRRGIEANAPDTLQNTLSGTAAIFSGLITMLWCCGGVKERGNLFFKALRLTGIDCRLYFFANAAALVILNGIFFGAVSAAIGAWFTGANFLTAAAYIICLSAMWTFFGTKIKSESLFLGLAVAVFLCSVLFGGVFINLGELQGGGIFVGLQYAFPVYYYMQGISGDMTAVGILAAIGILSAIGIFAGGDIKAM